MSIASAPMTTPALTTAANARYIANARPDFERTNWVNKVRMPSSQFLGLEQCIISLKQAWLGKRAGARQAGHGRTAGAHRSLQAAVWFCPRAVISLPFAGRASLRTMSSGV